MTKKKKRKKTRRRQQKRAAKAKKRRQTRRKSPPRPYLDHPGDLPDHQTLVRGMMEMESLAEEPEFADFELGEETAKIVTQSIMATDDEMSRLEEAGDEEGIEQLLAKTKLEVLQKAVTPAVKADIRRRLEALSRRLRREGQRQRAESIAALASMLDFPPFPWVMFEPVSQALDEVTAQTLDLIVLGQSIAEAAGRSAADIGPDEWSGLLKDPEVASGLEALYEANEILQETMERGFERVEKALTRRVSTGQFDLGLFSAEELALGVAWYEHERAEAEVEPTDEDEESDQQGRLVVEASANALRYINAPDRRQRWVDRLEKAITERAWPPDIEAGLRILSNELFDPPDPEGPERLLLLVYIGELFNMDDRLSTDPQATQDQGARIEEIRERLEKGEPPLT
jgi:hypothetical protein